MIPPTRENMEQAPIPTFLWKKPKIINLLWSVIEQGKRLISHDPEHINWQRKVKCNWKHPKTGMKHVFVIKMKQKSPLHSEYLHTHIERQNKCDFSSCILPLSETLAECIYPNPIYQQIYPLMWKTPQYSFTGGWPSYAPIWQKLLSALSAQAEGTFAPNEWNLTVAYTQPMNY